MKNKINFLAVMILAVTLALCIAACNEPDDGKDKQGNLGGNQGESNGIAKWARTVTAGNGVSFFEGGVTVDSSGNVYAAGRQSGNGSYTYGDGVTATGTYDDGSNAVLVKYNSSGTAQWARSVSEGNNNSVFFGVAVDSSGNVYVVGRQSGNGSFSYGDGVTATGAYAGGGYGDGNNAVLVKYNSNGTAQWAKTVTAGNNDSIFSGVTVDSLGNVFVVGRQYGNGSFTYGDGVTVTETSDNMKAVLIKYNSDGTAQWAKSVTAGNSSSQFVGVAESSGNVYVVGSQGGNGSFSYGDGVTATGAYDSGYGDGNNAVIVKYDSNGTAQWAKTVTAGNSDSIFSRVAVDSSGNVYAAGYQRGNSSFTYGDGVTAVGSYGGTDKDDYHQPNAVLVKYNSDGTAQWAKSVSEGNNTSGFEGVAVDSSGNVYTAGYQAGKGSFNYGNNVKVAGTNQDTNNYSAVLVKYNSSGTAQWARSTALGNNIGSRFRGVAVDSSDNLYAVGVQASGSYTYGTGVTITGSNNDPEGGNAVVVKYGN
jgi:hypothetical protein